MITVKYHVFTSLILIDILQCMKLGMQQSLILYYIYCDLVYVLKHAEVTAVHFIVTLPGSCIMTKLLHVHYCTVWLSHINQLVSCPCAPSNGLSG